MSDFHLDLGPLREPLGGLKVLEWLFSICVFATCGRYKGVTTILVSCGELVNRTVTADFAYPFRWVGFPVLMNALTVVWKMSYFKVQCYFGSGLNEASFTSPDPTLCNNTWANTYLVGNVSTTAQFFVTWAVLIFLYCSAALVLYLGYMHLYQNISSLPMMDYVFTLCAAFLWLVSTAAWATALVDIKISTGSRIVEEMSFCKLPGFSCVFVSVTSMRSLNVSLVFGLVNMILWAGNAWFVYKETYLHKPSSHPPNSGLYPPASGI